MKFQISGETAEILVSDPSTSPRLLAEMAAQHQYLWGRIRAHANVYDELLTWMDDAEMASFNGSAAQRTLRESSEAESQSGVQGAAETRETETEESSLPARGNASVDLGDADASGDSSASDTHRPPGVSSRELSLENQERASSDSRLGAEPGQVFTLHDAGTHHDHEQRFLSPTGEHEVVDLLRRQRELREQFEAEARARIESESREQIAIEARDRLQEETMRETRARAAAEARIQIEVEARAHAEQLVRSEREARAQVETKLQAEQEARNQTLELVSAEAQARSEIEAARLRAEDEVLQAQGVAQALQKELQQASYSLLEAEARLVAETDARVEAEAHAREESRLRAEAEAHVEVERQVRVETEQRIDEADRETAQTRAAAEHCEQIIEKHAQTLQEYAERITELEDQDEKARKYRHQLEIRLREEVQSRVAAEAHTELKDQALAEAEARESEQRIARVDAEERLRAAVSDTVTMHSTSQNVSAGEHADKGRIPVQDGDRT